VSDEQRQPGAPEVQIPDGGLGKAMPAWLQQPPAWKREPVEVPAPTRTLPPPDESVIDPRTMLDIDDLPRWLQDLVPDEPAEMDGGNDEPPVSTLPDEPGSDADGGPALVASTAEPERARAHAGPMVTTPSLLQSDPPSQTTPAHIVQDRTGPPPAKRISPPWWLSDQVLGLVLLGIALAMIYVVLAVAGVI
jgi:hypothetical protein